MKLLILLLLNLLLCPALGFLVSKRPVFGGYQRTTLCETKDATTTVERLENSAVLVHIPVPGKATKAAYDKVCMEISKQVQIPGFRKGAKIPPQVLEQTMAAKGGRNALKVQAINELVGQLIEPALKEKALDPIGKPTLKVPAEELAESFVAGEDLTLQVQCDIWPEIHWKEGDKPYVGLSGKYKRKPFNQERLDKAVRDLKERYVTLEPIEDNSYALQMGDACTVNMVGYMATEDGEKGDPLPSDVASGDSVEVVLGKGRYMEGLVEGIVGSSVGNSVTVSVSFPEKLRDKNLAGKQAIFDVEVLKASKRIVPEITDEFAAKVRDGLTADTLIEELRKAVDQEDSKEFLPARNKALGDSLATVMEVDVPDTLVTNQAREKFAMMMAEMRDGGVADDEIKRQINPENFLKYKEIVKDDIIRDFKISMATDEIARMEGIDVPTYQVDEQMEAIRKDAKDSEEFDENVIRPKVQTTLQRQAVFDWLAEHANLDVEYVEEEEFDAQLMQKLADDSIAREAERADSPAGTTVVDVEPIAKEETEASVPIEEPPPSSEAKEAPKVTITESADMSLEDRAFSALMNAGAIGANDAEAANEDEVAEGTVF